MNYRMEKAEPRQPDLILRRMDPDKPMRTALRLVYHVRCQGALERDAATPALWHMTHRYVEAEAN